MNNNNTYINAIKEFRRFANTYIYPNTASIIVGKICEHCNTSEILYESTPQSIIKFHSNINTNDNLSTYTHVIHDILKTIFIEYFNDDNISGLIKSRIHSDIHDQYLKVLLRTTLQEIQSGNPFYLGLLFKITILNDHKSYLYL